MEGIPCIHTIYIVKPVYKKLYALFIHWENEAALYRQWFLI